MDAKLFGDKVTAKKEAALKEAAEAMKGMTDGERDAFTMKVISKAKGDVKAEERAEALAYLMDIVKTVASDDPKAMESITLLTTKIRTPAIPGAKASGTRASRFTILDEQFKEIGVQVHEDELFKLYKQGRKDLYWIIADAIKGAKVVADRKWISFDPSTGFYTYEAKGELPPTGWKGYVPMAIRPATVPAAGEPVPAVPASLDTEAEVDEDEDEEELDEDSVTLDK